MNEPQGYQRLTLSCAFSLLILIGSASFAAERVPWTASRIKGSPEPPLPYSVERIFPDVEFTNPVDFALEPGTGRWFILQVDGKLYQLDPQNQDVPQLVFDAKASLAEHGRSYGLEFHPDFAKNRQLFLSYTSKENIEDGTRIVKVLVEGGETPKIDPETEELIITWPSGGHNGACMKFGDDGFLYITAGDGTGPFPPDSANVGQDIGDLRSTIMRIDVDHPDDNKPYSIPEDNPFLKHIDARPEVWAFGFRNPWKISFDSKTGELWCGDVGWELWELVFNVKKAGNYGWSIKEGSQPIRNDLKQGPGEITPPVVQHPHTEAASITGGYVYHGEKLPKLSGRYIYGDYVSGKIWALRDQDSPDGIAEEIADTSLAIITFGIDAEGELIVVDYAGGLYRIVPNPVPDTSKDFPKLLSETGLFARLKPSMQTHEGVYRYQTNTQLWQSGAKSSYAVAIPGSESIVWHKNPDRWQFPIGTVFAKTLSRKTLAHNELALRKIETQILHFNGLDWQPYSYLWNEDETEAVLVDAGGTTKELEIPTISTEESGAIDGKIQTQKQTWVVHSRSECSACHVPRAGNVLGFHLPNLKRESSWSTLLGPKNDTRPVDQVDLLLDLKIFDRKIPPKEREARLFSPHEEENLDTLARSYLHINCAHCHRRNGRGAAHIEFPFEHPLEKTRSVNATPTQGTFGIANAKIIAPGDPHRSVMYYRMATAGRGHMPHLGAEDVDTEGLDLIAKWIRSLSDEKEVTNPVPELLKFESESQRTKRIQQLLSSTESALLLAESISAMELGEDRKGLTDLVIASNPPSHIRGLFERFLPVEQRQKTLGTSIDVNSILAMQGDIETGKRFFHLAEGITCRNCHQIGKSGKQVGPDLSKIGAQRSRREILDSILYPSLKIDQKYATRTLVTLSGKVVSGIVSKETEEAVHITDSAGKQHEILKSKIGEMVTQPRSLMPDLLTKEMTAKELVNLLDYLHSLK